MVTTSSAVHTQANESEKRRKQTLERAKANHLSRQLQMRLQYARLKVDHGWQKQNLNEVENLYFHHSHQRGPRSNQTSPLIATTHHDAISATASNSSQSSLSFKLGPSNLSRSITNTTLGVQDEGGGQASVSSLNADLSLLPPNLGADAAPTSNSWLIDPSLPSKETQPIVSLEVDHENKRSPTPTTSRPVTSSQQVCPQAGLEVSSANQSERSSKSPRTPKLPSTSWTAASAFTFTYPKATQRTQPHNQPNATTTSPDAFNFSSSSLTYDSFWSSHSASTGSRPFRGSIGNVLAEAPGPSFGESGGTKTTSGTTLYLQSGMSTSATDQGGKHQNAIQSNIVDTTGAGRVFYRKEG